MKVSAYENFLLQLYPATQNYVCNENLLVFAGWIRY